MVSERAIFDKSSHCLDLFNSCIQSMTTTPWPQDQLDRFNLWTAHGGIFGEYKERTSMDWRLRNRPELVEMMLQLLSLLQDYLSGIHNLVDPSGESKTIGGKDDLTAKQGRDRSPPLSLSGSSTSSTTSSTCSISPTIGQTSAIKDPVATCQSNVEQTIDRLFRLSAVIRSAGMSYRYSKAANFVEYEQGVNLTQKFREGVELLLKHKRPSPCGYMVKRLVESMCLRQRELAYSFERDRARQVASRAASQRFGIIDDALGNLPPPPDWPETPQKRELACPYCAVPFERATFEGPAWRYHVLKDLRPYICILPHCKRPHANYECSTSWTDHMRTEHKVTKWKCTATSHPEPRIVDTEADFVAHTMSEHKGAFTPDEMLELANLGRYEIPRELDVDLWSECPLCMDSLVDQNAMDVFCHIAKDLVEYANLCLPESLVLVEGQSQHASSNDPNMSDRGTARRRESEVETDIKIPWSLLDVDSPKRTEELKIYMADLTDVPDEDDTRVLSEKWKDFQMNLQKRLQMEPDPSQHLLREYNNEIVPDGNDAQVSANELIIDAELVHQYSRTKSVDDLHEEAIRIAFRARHLYNLMVRLGDRYSKTGSMDDLEEAIRIGQAAVDATLENHPDRAGRLNDLGVSLSDRYSRTGSMYDLEEAIPIGQAAVDTTPEDHPDRAGRLNNLGVSLSDRYSRTRSMYDLEEAIRIGKAAVDATPEDHPDRAGRLNNIGVRLIGRYSKTGSINDLEEAIRIGQAAVDATPEDHPDRAGRLNNLGVSLGVRYSRTRSIHVLEEAIRIGQVAVDATPEDHPDRAGRLNNLGVSLSHRYLRTGPIQNLEEAIRIGRAAVDATPEDHPGRARYLNNLGVRLGDRYSKTGSIDHLKEAIRIGRAAVDATPEHHADRRRGRYLNNLEVSLGNRYLQTGSMDDLEEAIRIGRAAVGATPEDHPDRALYLNKLEVSLGDRYLKTGSMDDLDEAIRFGQAAIDATPDDYPDRARHLINLEARLDDRYRRKRSMDDLQEAIRIGQAAVDAILEDHPDRAGCLNNLGVSLSDRYSRTGSMYDLEEAIPIGQAAVDATPDDHPDRAQRDKFHLTDTPEA